MDRTELLQRVRAGRIEWADLIECVPHDRRLELIWTGGWNLRDLVAHMGFHEAAVEEFIRMSRWPPEEPGLEGATTNSRNDWFQERIRDLPFEDARNAADAVHERLVDAIAALTDDEYLDRDRNGTPAAEEPRPISIIVANNTFHHYAEHAIEIRAWLATLR